jgi:hypothetical protein
VRFHVTVRLHWSAIALECDCIGVRLHWSASAVECDCSGVRLQWSASALECECSGVRLHWSAIAVECDCIGVRLHWSASAAASFNKPRLWHTTHSCGTTSAPSIVGPESGSSAAAVAAPAPTVSSCAAGSGVDVRPLFPARTPSASATVFCGVVFPAAFRFAIAARLRSTAQSRAVRGAKVRSRGKLGLASPTSRQHVLSSLACRHTHSGKKNVSRVD